MLLRNKDRESLISIFSQIDIPFEVWAYGSRVNGTAHDGSDLDLVLRSKNGKEIPFDIFMVLKDKIKHSNIPIIVELFEWSRLPESFHKNIEARYEVLYRNEVSTD